MRTFAASIGFLAAALAATLPDRAQANWSDVIIDMPGSGGPACLSLARFPDSDTIANLKMDRGDFADGEIVLMLLNLNWSVKEGDDVGVLDLVHEAGGARIKPIAFDGALVLYLAPDALVDWAASNTGTTFAVYRRGVPLMRMPSDGLVKAIRAVNQCARIQFR
jgi:hypothetical protein